jgi:UDP-N-acetylglucosamine 2-epimerase
LCAAFQTLVEKHDDLHLFYPVHMNPRVGEVVRRRLSHPRAHLLPALGYFDLIHLLRRSHFVLTDSGGLQEEAPSLGKPVVILRKVTERPEAVNAGVAVLAGTKTDAVVRVASRLLRDPAFYNSMARGSRIYGDGRASARIVATLRHHFGLLRRRPGHFQPVMEGSK